MEFAFKVGLRAQNGLEEAGKVLKEGSFFSGHRHHLDGGNRRKWEGLSRRIL